MTKTEIKKKKKRLALMDSAYHLFTTVGFQNTTITDIAKNADKSAYIRKSSAKP